MKFPMYLKECPSFERLQELSLLHPDIDPAACEAYLHVLRAGTALRNRLEHYLARYGISHSRFMLLAILNCAVEPLPLSELAKLTGVTPPTVTSVLGGLVAEEYVSRRTDPSDKRAVLVELAPKGRELLERILPDLFRRQALTMADLNQAEQRELSRLLDKVEPDRLAGE